MNDREHQAPLVLPVGPVHVARAVARLSAAERLCFHKALRLLRGGGGVRALARGAVPVAGPGVYEALLARSWAVRHRDVEEMVRLAAAAVEVAQDLSPRRHGRREVADFQARAWGELANAHRAARHLGFAEWAFGEAFALLAKGTGDSFLRAWLFELEASLLGTSGKIDAALDRLVVLGEVYRALGHTHLAGRALVIRALFTFHSGRAEEAYRLNQEGIALLDRQREPDVLRTARQNQLVFLAVLGGLPDSEE